MPDAEVAAGVADEIGSADEVGTTVAEEEVVAEADSTACTFLRTEIELATSLSETLG